MKPGIRCPPPGVVDKRSKAYGSLVAYVTQTGRGEWLQLIDNNKYSSILEDTNRCAG